MSAVDPELVHEPAPPVLGVGDDRVDRVVETTLGVELKRTRLTGQEIVGGQDQRAGGEQEAVDRLHGQPLEVDDVGRRGVAAQGQHVRHVLGELAGQAQAGRRAPHGVGVEELAHAVAVGGGDRAVGERARDQLHLGPGPGQRGAQRVVIGRRVGGGIDDLDAHRLTPADGRPAWPGARRCPGCARPEGVQPGLRVALQPPDRGREHAQRRLVVGARRARSSRLRHGMAEDQTRPARQEARQLPVVLQVVDRRRRRASAWSGARGRLTASTRTWSRLSASSAMGSSRAGKAIGHEHDGGRLGASAPKPGGRFERAKPASSSSESSASRARKRPRSAVPAERAATAAGAEVPRRPRPGRRRVPAGAPPALSAGSGTKPS